MTAVVYDFPTLTRAAPQSIEIGLKANCAVFVSPLSGDVQTIFLPGARWTLSFAFNALERADAGELEALQALLRGQANRARVPVWGRVTPRGDWAGAPLVAGAGQTGTTIACDGFTAGATVKRGDYFNLGTNGELKRITADGAADGSGALTLEFEPAIRTAPPDNTALVFTNCVVPRMIPSDPHLRHTIAPGNFADFSFDLVEVFA